LLKSLEHGAQLHITAPTTGGMGDPNSYSIICLRRTTNAHPVSIAMKKMQDVPEVRIIEGLSTVNKKGGEQQ
jgi:hypothetical protein